jgi:hypothetical protein
VTKTVGASSEDLRAVIEDPVRFARGLLRTDVRDLQESILRSVEANPRTAVKACHASGKTFVAALAVLWWVTRFRDGIVVTTAPTWTQVEKLLWGEIHKAMQRSRIRYPEATKTELKLGPGNFAIGLSTNEGVRFQGFHGEHVLIVLDEAPGVLPEIWEAIEGIRAGGKVHVLALGNPTIASGPFHDAFTSNRDGWKTFIISAFDTPNLAGLTRAELLCLPDDEIDASKTPYLVTRRWVREKWREWGLGHPLWESRVLGQFPAQSDNALISLAWLEEASGKPPIDTGGPLRAGIDVAGPGEDETVLAVVDGSSILSIRSWTKADPRGEVVAALAPFKARLETVNIDSAGIGHFFGKHLEDLGYPVRLVNVGRQASRTERYANLKAEFYWGLRQRFEERDIAGLTDERTIAQLAAILHEHDARGRVVIENKEDARKRGVKSPDRAEALMLAFAQPVLGWTLVTFDEAEEPEKPVSVFREQLEAQLPVLAELNRHREACGTCVYFELVPGSPRGKCRYLKMVVAPDAIECGMWSRR